MRRTPLLGQLASVSLLCTSVCHGADEVVLPPVNERYGPASVKETPGFQRHVVPLFGRLGCNGRSCHGSLQGQGGFRLSLFGYDFKADHAALFDKESPRVDLQDPDESLIIVKPTDGDRHDGGTRYQKGSWENHVLRRWIESGGKLEVQPEKLLALEVTPAEIWFQKQGQQVRLKAVAVWEDGTREEVTPLCRFQNNDEQVAAIDENGLVTANEPGDSHVVVFYDNGVTPIPVIRPVTDKIAEKYPRVPTPTKIDELVVAKLRKLGIVPSELSSDAEFLRRISLDITGTLPTPKEVQDFLADNSLNKRAAKIEQLLQTPAYAAWWATKLCDYTGNNDDQLNNVGPMRGQASREWYDWIHARVADNTPYDELAAGIVTAVSRRPGQDYLDYCKEMSDLYRKGSKRSFADLPSMTHYWSRRDFRDPDARVIAVAYSFMGIRIQCAQCHKHPFDQWSKDDFHEFKNFFAGVVGSGRTGATPEARKQYNQLVQQLGLKNARGNDLRRQLPKLLDQGKTVPFPEVYVNKPRVARAPRASQAASTARLLGGEEVDLTQDDDPRTMVMAWLRDPDNRFFARAFVNRVWASYFNVGIVNPPDDHSLANPPSNEPLLDYLADGFVGSGFDMKWVHREIANSRTYQLSWEPNETNGHDTKNFSHAIPRRLPAEVAYDAIQQATASDERMAQMQSDVRSRAIAIPGAGSRNNRAGGASYALTIFGRSTRDSNCDCDRSMEASLLQTVYLQNDREVLQLVDVRKGSWLEQVARKLNPKKASAANDADVRERQLRDYRKQIASAKARMERLKKTGNELQIAKFQKRLASLQRQVAELERKRQIQPERSAVNEAEISDIVAQAYLRTLSRTPDESELARSVHYVQQSEDAVDGVRDVLWALLNTKEFIVNN